MENKTLKSILLNLLSECVGIVITQVFWVACALSILLFLHQLFN